MEMGKVFKTNEGKNDVIKFYDKFLQKLALSYEKFYVDTRYGKTFIIASGEKSNPSLILLHGSGMNSVMWLRDIKEYSKTYRVYAIDMLGEPGKSDENRPSLSGSSYAEWLKEVFENLSVERANIIGISLGAWLAIKFSVSYPEMVSKLVLLCPSGVGPQKKSFIFKAIAYGILGEKGIDKLYYKVNGNQPIPEEMLKYQKLIGKSFNYRKETIPVFSDNELKLLTMPTVLFVGAKDIMLHSDKTARRLGNLLPHAQINISPKAGHSNVNDVNKIIEWFNFSDQ
ncbi:alpha/beta fold hydrolase [Clostridium beijerinckii]|uniref:Pimeloyl-ACP methyl ester carboxylesterase n=1 Tax=Clostridium beijerinckii TaxID=1520 RepID=A0AAX0BB47_CLOBE|nr:alpha/beta hydrolase [Clostridium beijerinckii]MBA8933815.1 pimeloyl-ACP methyl ester carboxylesterase [Clostridium beijerinckii]NOW05256.1 pimeloyl-ACP methyl ester carboxylesterase [Clostridium beijerinckii]NRT36272.1 pimeloyl-ACP methyl ester carboxylesterase [Clostridium beijerinckii]NRT44300.1 pimeloyl-ACP methyl ester carboxylesterase [Clostridium beijerinckii]NRT92196.1 pimeloyl-ACP methyl ester carboxylesterase [Clostridium beijerinckii]